MNDVKKPGVQGTKNEGQGEIPGNQKPPEDMYSVVYIRLAAIFIITAAFLATIGFGICSPTFLNQLSNENVARGFITFLVALGTIALAILLVIYSITFRKNTDSDIITFKDRFGRGQQVFTALIGILGTIVGFYFGSTSTIAETKELSVNTIKIDKRNPKPGEIINLTSSIEGGNAPYIYDIFFDPDNINPIHNYSSRGEISEFIEISNDITPGTEFSIVFKVTDDDGLSETIGTDKNPKIKVIPGKKGASRPSKPGS